MIPGWTLKYPMPHANMSTAESTGKHIRRNLYWGMLGLFGGLGVCGYVRAYELHLFRDALEPLILGV